MKTCKLICKAQVRTIEDVVEDWKADHRCAMKVRDIEEIIRLCVFLGDGFKSWSDDLWEDATKGIITCPQSEGEAIFRTIDEATALIQGVLNRIAWAEKNGYSVEDREKFMAFVQNLADLKTDLLARWPMVDEEQINRSREEFRNGQFQTAEEVLRELQDTNPA